MDAYPYGTLNGLDTEELFIMIYLLVDRYLIDREKHCGPLRRNTNGAVARFTDAEVITVSIVGELKQPPSERAWYHELNTTFKPLFPELLERSRLLRRKIALGPVIEAFRRKLIEYLGLDEQPERFMDSKPVILAHITRARRNQNKRFRTKWLRDKHSGLVYQVEPGMATIGYCATKREHYFGMKLHMMISFAGIPLAWGLTAANIDDRQMVCPLLEVDPRVQRGGNIRIWADNGYEGQEIQMEVADLGHELYPYPKKKKSGMWPVDIRRWVRRHRQKLETKFSEGKRFVNLETPRAASEGGLMAQIVTKITALTLYMLAPVLPQIAEMCL